MGNHKSINHLNRNLDRWKEERDISLRKINRYKKFIKKHKKNIETCNTVIVNIENELKKRNSQPKEQGE